MIYNRCMKKIFKNKVIVIAILFALLGVGGFVYYRIQLAGKKTINNIATQEQGKEGAATEKTDNPPSENVTPETSTTTETTNTAVGILTEVSLTAYLQTEDTTSQDGKTTVLAGSIMPYFYLPGGIYTVQKLVGATWKDVASSVNYPGHGGLLASFAGPTEDNISYRVLKIEGGTTKAVSKTFVVKRADFSGNIKSYN
jgi:hypothetical protein